MTIRSEELNKHIAGVKSRIRDRCKIVVENDVSSEHLRAFVDNLKNDIKSLNKFEMELRSLG